jgi:hypothetical protein
MSDTLSDSDVLDALMTQIGNGFGVPVAFPLVTFTPPANGGSYVQVHPIMRLPPNHPWLGDGGTIYGGILQADAVVSDNGAGEPPGLALAALIKARFPRGSQVVAGQYRVQFQRVPTIAAAVKDAPYLRFPVSIPFVIYT